MRRSSLNVVFCTTAALAVAAGASLGRAEAAEPDALAAALLRAAGVRGGLVVHVGCGDGRLTAALRAGDAYLVQGLERGEDAVEAARRTIQSLGAYGPVSVAQYDGRRLPYADNLVNLLVVSRGDRLELEECLRVLAPRGVLFLAPDAALGGVERAGTGAAARLETTSVGEATWGKLVKPRPAGMDEWTHALHDPGGNPVARDRLVGPPARLQWTDGPLWARSHGWTPSVSAMVSAGGRVFAICDETLTCADGTIPSQWRLVARDAFSGVVLWKRPISQWGSAALSGTPDAGRVDGVVGRFTMPPNVGKRLVAVGDTVYAALGPRAPVTALDAATGEVKRVYEATAGADEILCVDGRLIVAINPPRAPLEAPPPKTICAVDAASGRLLWRKGPFPAVRATVRQDPYGRVELAAGDDKVFLLTTETIECLDGKTGQSVWKIPRPALPEQAVRRVGFAGVYEYQLTVLVYHNGVVLLAQPEPNTHHTYHTMPGTLYAFDARNGRLMWRRAYGAWGHCTPPDVFVVDEVVWTHVYAETEFGFVWGKGYKAADPSKVDYRIQALDLRTGRLLRETPTRLIFNVGHHHRCYRNRSTERFLLSCRRGVEFVDLATGENDQDHWVRSGCLLGYLPCNGLLYVTPHPCGCYRNALLTGFNALAAADWSRLVREEGAPDARLLRGPAYGAPAPAAEPGDAEQDWPTYRHDGQRSGATEAKVGPRLELAWRTEIGGEPSAPIIAGGRVLAADAESHRVWSLDLDGGEAVWSFTAEGRVASPPSCAGGRVLFGAADGRVYCVRAADGRLVWRFDAAPERRLITAFGQLESAWPVPGVLVHDGACWAPAGRSSYLDGGVRLYALDPATGRVVRRETISHRDPVTGKMPQVTDAHQMDGLLNDIPSTDGAGVFIRQMEVVPGDGTRRVRVYTTAGYLDPSWFNRTYWFAGAAQTSGLMVLGDGVAYGMELFESRSRETVFTPGSHPYRLRCLPLKRTPSGAAGRAGGGRRQGPRPVWERRLPIRVTALVRAGGVLFAAGSPDVVDPKDPHGAWEGRKGGVLAAVDAASGELLAQYALPAPPVWDGMAASPERLVISTLDGAVLCFRTRSAD